MRVACGSDANRRGDGESESDIFGRVQLARVIGRVVATIKQDTLAAVTLQWIQPVSTSGADAGKPLVAVDRVGVGPGEVVYFITSREAALTLDEPFAAVDAGIVGKVDWVDVDGERRLMADDASQSTAASVRNRSV